MVPLAPAEVVPHPRCDGLAAMASPPRWQQCFTVPNLDSFTNYIAYYASEAEVTELLQLPVVYHRGAFDAVAVRVAVGVIVGQRWVALPQAECEWAGCERCRSRGGGYSFHWIHERWTPEAALDLSLTREELRLESFKPWPEGILQPPHPQNEPGVLLTTMWEFDTDLFTI